MTQPFTECPITSRLPSYEAPRIGQNGASGTSRSVAADATSSSVRSSAAKPTQTFTTTLNVNQQLAAGSYNGGFFVPTSGVVPSQFVQVDINVATATPNLAVALYPFTLKAGAGQKAALLAYFNAKPWPPEYLTRITDQINGKAPFFYLNSLDGLGSYSLVDAFSVWLNSANLSPVVDNDYPVGTYLYVATLNGLSVQVKMKVYRA
jgi:hypothetical protein